ncbi:hypothetical protein MHAE_15550 [Mycobacterium haemophilum DSM 44634]|uniref:DUF6545 domain-containing protein n=1 Tax=Mycobacterium haemophilum TaxID=29311 RepID=UPI0006552717|nr:DUF6545 domain-containing protein [Mycobacterium haemophilum]AKN15334.1 hypothetical protein B586_00220 [Mycobacterium haemophilum DSM 44634]MCV7342086.1 hypothetical protein [Mycobacterium haemophilum DSM 44634]
MTRARRYRRVIEIRDALLILQPHLHPETTTRAEQLATTAHHNGLLSGGSDLPSNFGADCFEQASQYAAD